MAKILVIDDESGIRSLLCGVQQAAGHRAEELENGGAVVEHLEHDVDLLITDIFMPDVEGLETIREVRRRRPELPIIAISGVDFEGDDYLGVARKFGAVATLKKPFWPGDLLELVSRLLTLA